MHSEFSTVRSARDILAGLLLCACFTACSGSQAVIRIDSNPSGAGFFVPRLNLQGQTPYDFVGLDPDDNIVIGMEGYRELNRRVSELKKINETTYRADLIRER